MATNKDKLFLSREDIEQFRPISKNVDSLKIDAFIGETQRIEIRSFLGVNLYALMQADYDEGTKAFSEDRFTDLWFGVDYINKDDEDVKFNGLINAASYFTYARFILQQQINVSRFGVESVQNEISEDIGFATIKTKSREAVQVALAFQNDARAFMESKEEIYPEFKNPYEGKKTSFSFFKV